MLLMVQDGGVDEGVEAPCQAVRHLSMSVYAGAEDGRVNWPVACNGVKLAC